MKAINIFIKPFVILVENWELTKQLTLRSISEKYKGSLLGSIWSIITPLLMLSVYTFFFSVVFKARWGGEGVSDSKAEFAIILFCGLMIFNFFAECINKAPFLVIGNTNYVKKIVFPLEILAWVNVLSAFFNFVIGFIVWFLFYLLVFGVPHMTFLMFPIVMLPLFLLLIGLSWLLSSISVYIRDVSQLIPPLTSVLLFMSPIFYALKAIPESYRFIFMANPITPVVEEARNVLIYGKNLDLSTWGLSMGFSLFVFAVGFSCFNKIKNGFADVL
ncbi:ABC transporter permease [Photobacterium lipolyticum]|uniref:ABC transporter permease n=1 Tax=Photobacterium lipolyticum TaxID=266810 RepID=UPI001FEA8578|nr:ABC transporter permease [Photobacterium lipolyticum]